MFKRKTDAAPAATISVNDAVQHARTRARQRLIGAVVLLVIGVIGFPLVFESQPRPIPVDIPIDIPKKDGVAPLVMPAERVVVSGASAPAVADASTVAVRETAKDRGDAAAASAQPLARESAHDAPTKASTRPADEVITESKAEAGHDVTSMPAKPAASSVALAKPIAKPTAASASISSTVKVAALPLNRTSDGALASAANSTVDKANTPEGDRARALLEGNPIAAADSPRFIVQVGAFADADAARTLRLKVEKLGMKTYTQIAQTPAGGRMIRVRVGPFASRVEADRALAKARSAGITANVLTL